jgi:hypothetical protein
VDSPAFAARAATNKTFVNLDGIFAANAITLWPNHARPQLVKNLKCGFIAGKTELPLKLQCRLTRRLGGGEIRRPEPS